MTKLKFISALSRQASMMVLQCQRPGISFCQHGGLVLRKSGRSGGISWYGWMAILVVQLNRSNKNLKTVWKTISTYEGWLTSTLTCQASMPFCSAEKIIYMTTQLRLQHGGLVFRKSGRSGGTGTMSADYCGMEICFTSTLSRMASTA